MPVSKRICYNARDTLESEVDMQRGRQKTGLPTKTRWLTTRATDDDLETLRRGAELAGLSVSEFTRLTALDAAKALQSNLNGDTPR